MGQPQHLTIRPVALAWHLGRTQLAKVLEQCAEQHRLVAHPVAVAHQGQGQLLESQIGVGRDRVKVKRDVFHAMRATMRCSIRAQTWRFAGRLAPLHWQISSSVRKQPTHSPLAASMRHTDIQGEGTNVPPDLANAARAATISIAFSSPTAGLVWVMARLNSRAG